MTKLGGHMQSIRGAYEDVVLKLARIHLVWRDYDRQLQRNKADAAAARDRRIHEIIS